MFSTYIGILSFPVQAQGNSFLLPSHFYDMLGKVKVGAETPPHPKADGAGLPKRSLSKEPSGQIRYNISPT